MQDSTLITNDALRRNAVQRFGDGAFVFGVFLMAASLPLSKFGMSLAQFFLAGGWLLGENPIHRFKKVLSIRPVQVLLALYGLLLLGLWNTQDMSQAGFELRIRAPLFIMPIVFADNRLTVKQYRNVLFVFVLAVFVATCVGMYRYLGLGGIHVKDIRNIVLFVSHIRLSLMICVSVVLVILWTSEKGGGAAKKAGALAVIVWFLYFLVILESLTGLGILVFLGLVWLLRLAFQQGRPVILRMGGVFVMLSILIGCSWLFKTIFVDSVEQYTVDVDTLPKTTQLGNAYIYDLHSTDVENGHMMGLYLSLHEMDSAWQARTGMSAIDTTEQGDQVHFIVWRFLNSKGLPKDAAGVAALSEEEVAAIRKGTGSINNLQGGVLNRLKLMAWEYRQYYFSGNPSGHSFTMRLEFWKTGWYIFKRNLWTGVGTGDVWPEYGKAYEDLHSKLQMEYRFVSHNQYLRTAVQFGIPGLLIFLFVLIYPAAAKKFDMRDIYFWFWIILMCSMLTEDTFETQAGATFYGFLNVLFFFGRKTKDESLKQG